MLRLIWLASIFIFLSTGCGKFDSASAPEIDYGPVLLDATPFGTCDRKAVVTINLCVEVIGVDYDEPGYLSIFQSSCESTGGTFSTNLCDRTTSFGTCAIYPNQTNETHVLYYPPLYTATTAQAACAATPGGVYISN